MAKVYRAPASIAEPQYSRDTSKWIESEQAYIAEVSEEARARHHGDIVGEVVSFPVGDGAAQYVVWNTNPCEIVHLEVGDAWSIPEAHARGLRTKDLRQQVKTNHFLRGINNG